MMKGREGGTLRRQEGGATRGNATTSLRKMTRGRCSERTTTYVDSVINDCSDYSNGGGDGDGDSSNGDSGDDDTNSDSGSGDSNSGEKKNNQLKPSAEKVETAADAALASILLAS
jgi:hypothetical protein